MLSHPKLLSTCTLLQITAARFTLHDILAPVPKEVSRKEQASYFQVPVSYQNIQIALLFVASFKARHSKSLNTKAKPIGATSPLIFWLYSSLIQWTLYQKGDCLVLGTWMNFLHKLYLEFSKPFSSHSAEGLRVNSGSASYPHLMQTPILLRGECIQHFLLVPKAVLPCKRF